MLNYTLRFVLNDGRKYYIPMQSTEAEQGALFVQLAQDQVVSFKDANDVPHLFPMDWVQDLHWTEGHVGEDDEKT